jgi:L-threonylcarbamoyladenylate synthase
MIVINYQKKHHKKIIHACVMALKKGKVVAYPTDTSYGLAVDVSNISAVKNLYKVKGRSFKKAVSIVSPSLVYSKKIAKWDKVSSRLAKKFWPGALTLVLPVGKGLHLRQGYGGQVGPSLQRLTNKGSHVAIRLPNNVIALDLSHLLGNPITATSANVSGNKDCYSVPEIIAQFKNNKYKPDIIIDAGKLPKRKPSTLVKIHNEQIEILRQGPISKNQILKAIK